MALVVWALVLAFQPGTARARLWAVAFALLAGTGAAWLAVILGLSGSLWALLRGQEGQREDLVMAGLGVAALAGLSLLLACLPVAVLLVVDTRALIKRLDEQRPPMRLQGPP